MKGDDKERWMELCAQATTEEDPKKLLELVEQINFLLDKKSRRLKDVEQDTRNSI